jgi:anthranilate phosphoribosyltransferase
MWIVADQNNQATIDHSSWQQLLNLYLVTDANDGINRFDYAAVTAADRVRLSEYISRLAEIDPRDYGFRLQPLSSIVARNASESLEIINAVFDDRPGPARDIVVLNAGAAIHLCGFSPTLAEGFERAAALIAEGAARERFRRFIEFTQTTAEA